MTKSEMIEILMNNLDLIEDLNNIPESALRIILDNADLLENKGE
jgi:hypothetical protein